MTENGKPLVIDLKPFNPEPLKLLFGKCPPGTLNSKGTHCTVGIVGGALPILVEYVQDGVVLRANMLPAYARHVADLFLQAADKCDALQEEAETAKAKSKQLKLI